MHIESALLSGVIQMGLVKKLDKNHLLLALCFIIIGSSAVVGYAVQNNFGTIDSEYIRIADQNGLIVTGKLYRPLTATKENPAPGVLLLHGMNNDKDTEGPAALELAKRGIVALAIDQLSHGDSDRIHDVLGYLTGAELETLGGNASYQFLKSLDFVDETKTGLVGHSMGAGTATSIASTNPDHRAIVIQADGPYNLTENDFMNNYLAVWSFYEELFTTQPRQQFLQDSLEMITQNEGLSDASEARVDYTYGSFQNDSAHRYAKCPCTHPGATWNQKGVAETTAWMLQALMGYSESAAWDISGIETQTYLIREGATLLALIASVLSLIPIASIFLHMPYFHEISTSLPEKIPTQGRAWWIFAVVNSIIGGVTFLFLPDIGMLLGVVLGSIVPIFPLVTGNGALLWFLVNALITWVFFRFWYKKKAADEDSLAPEDVGRIRPLDEPANRRILFKTGILSIILVSSLYLVVSISHHFLGIEFRYMWPVLRIFTPDRFFQFLVYSIPVLPFFLINGGVFLFGMIRQPQGSSPLKTQMLWWAKIVFAMESTLLVFILLNYLPMFLLGTGPVLTMGLFGIFLMSYLPIFGGIFFIMTSFYRRTGRIYLGSMVGTLLMVWIMSAGMLI